MRIIALGHYSRTGKDTFANYLKAALNEMAPNLKVGCCSFAAKLKDVTHQLYGWAGLQTEAYYNDPEHEHERTVILPALNMTPVDVWVRFGTLAVREKVYDPTWVDYRLNTEIDLDVMILTDNRFFNEVLALRAKDAHLIKIVRPGYGPKMTVADLALIDYQGWDNVIGDHREPDGMANLNRWARAYSQAITGKRPWESILRPPEDIQEALKCQDLPLPEEVEAVFQNAGLNYADYKPEN